MTIPALERRRAERKARMEEAAAWAERLASHHEVTAVVVFGSTARGDLNKWSDVDVLVVAPELPAGWRDRDELLRADATPGLQPWGGLSSSSPSAGADATPSPGSATPSG